MSKTDLVILKENASTNQFEKNEFKKNTFYRCLRDEVRNEYYINGVCFGETIFNELFEYGYDKLMRSFKAVGLLTDNNKPVTKKRFKELVDVHKYGNGRTGLYRGFVLNRDRLTISFKSYFRENKKTFIDFMYFMYEDIIEGNVNYLRDDLIEIGNSGIPISYHPKLRWQ